MVQRRDQPVQIRQFRDPVSVHSELQEIEFRRFEAQARGSARRSGLYAVFGAMIVVSIGVWGFRFETNTRNAPMLRPLTQRGPTVMVVITPH